MKILFAIDGSAYSQKILDYVCTQESLFAKSHQYTLLNVQIPLPGRARAMASPHSSAWKLATQRKPLPK